MTAPSRIGFEASASVQPLGSPSLLQHMHTSLHQDTSGLADVPFGGYVFDELFLKMPAPVGSNAVATPHPRRLSPHPPHEHPPPIFRPY